jgi:hypothetical protein
MHWGWTVAKSRAVSCHASFVLVRRSLTVALRRLEPGLGMDGIRTVAPHCLAMRCIVTHGRPACPDQPASHRVVPAGEVSLLRVFLGRDNLFSTHGAVLAGISGSKATAANG